MKCFGFLLLGLPFLLSLGCSTTVPSGSAPASHALKDNQKQVLLIRVDGKTGNLTVEENGAERTYAQAAGCKYYDNPHSTIASSSLGAVMKSDVILTIEKKDGKDLVTEVRGAELAPKLTTRGTRVEGLYKGRDGKSGDVLVQVGGEEKRYTTDDSTRFNDAIGRPVQPPIGNTFPKDSKVELAVDKKNGKDYAIEMRPAK